MTLALYGGKVAGKLLFAQLMTLVLFSVLFALQSPRAAASAAGGGLAAWLPNVVFMLFACRHQAAVSGRIAWSFSVGEGLKMAATIALLVVALGMFKAAFVPLGLTYLSVLIVQILAPAVINNKG
ncbi:F0F1 ATP synthase subunit I [Candidatus Sodalis pierantonius str. SOPE]|uniref:F0F1 ATP synthase subunit I n=1 Tax=Candidatus Sodalis pierantonii str. SOPE TaxID=2342 RepID=W0HGG7_9GAMM|nr:F0F1 ATP synthase subunit I [Candidatus Sodalis pierantonius]AHF72811.1 F0F1 ATP synthase subunit I [Candidatus Sodalis pierantonius str. SOPE]